MKQMRLPAYAFTSPLPCGEVGELSEAKRSGQGRCQASLTAPYPNAHSASLKGRVNDG